MKSRLARNLAAIVILSSTAASAFAIDTKRVISYYGWPLGDGTAACTLEFGPPIPPELVGQRIRECDYSTWSWGHTVCNPETEYFECELSASAETGQAASASECATTEVAEVAND